MAPSETIASFRFCSEDASTQKLSFHVHGMRGEEVLGGLFEYRVKLTAFDSADASLVDGIASRKDVPLSAFMNKDACLSVPLTQEQGDVREFNGLVTDVRLVDHFAPTPASKWFHYEVVIRPRLWLLGLSAQCRVFSRMTVLEIVKKILDEASIDHDMQCHDTYPSMELCVQYNETDLDFVGRLLQREGIYYYFVHRSGKHVMLLTDDVSESALTTPNPKDATPVISYQCTVDEINQPGIYRWHCKDALMTEGVTLTSFDFKSAKTHQDHALESRVNADVLTTGAAARFYVPHYKTVDDGERLVKAYLTSHQSRTTRVVGEGNMRNVSVGGLFTLDGHIRQEQNKKYVVTHARYRIRTRLSDKQMEDCSQDPQADDTISGHERYRAEIKRRRKNQRFTCKFEAAFFDKGFRPPLRGRQSVSEPVGDGYARHPLFQTAIVVGVEGKEADADTYARIKVRFHWESQDSGDDVTTRPGLRLSKLWAGSRFGVHVLPRLGQEVVVAFTDVDEPIIVGCVDNQANMPPHDPSRFPGISTIRTQSLEHEDECSELRFNDDAMQMLLYTTGRYDNRVEKDKLIWVGQNEHHHVKGAQRLQVSEQDLTVDKDQKLKVGGNASLTVEGSQACEVKGEYSVEGQTASLHAKSNVVIGSQSAIVLNVGSSTIKIDEAGVHVQGVAINLNTGGGGPPSLGKGSPELPTAPDEADNGKLDS